MTDPGGRASDDGTKDCCSNLKGFSLAFLDNVKGSNLTQKYDNSSSSSFNNDVKTGNGASFIAGGLVMLNGVNDIGAGGTGLVASGALSSTGGGTVAGG